MFNIHTSMMCLRYKTSFISRRRMSYGTEATWSPGPPGIGIRCIRVPAFRLDGKLFLIG